MQGKPLYLTALECFEPFFAQAVIVLPQSWEAKVESQVRSLPYRDRLVLERGGVRRQDSVLRGVRRLSESIKLVLVHDAARPCVSADLISRVMKGAQRYKACVPVVPVVDTVKEIRDGRVVRTLERNHLGLVQTPQGFEIELLKRAFERAQKESLSVTDEAGLVESMGSPVHVVNGEAGNIKVTWESDLRGKR